MANITDRVSYKVGFIIGELIKKFIKLLWAGIVTASCESKLLLFSYIGLSVATMISYIAFQTCSFMIMTIIVVATFAGLWIRAKEKPYKDRVKYFNYIFEQIGLKSKDESLPTFLYEQEISDFTTLFAFETFIPLAEWKSKKEQLEMYFNVEIVNIKQDQQNNRVIQVLIKKTDLPTYLEYDYEVSTENDTYVLGVGYNGYITIDLNKNAHTIIAGETGSGKSNILKLLVYQSLVKYYDVVLIDFKRGVSFSNFNGLVEIVYEYEKAVETLENMVNETKRRLDLFRVTKVDNIKDYNKITTLKNLKREIIFIDELAELLNTRDKELSNRLYDALETLTRLSRAAGIHLIIGIQRPDANTVNGQIKNNISCRVCGRFVDKEPSRIMLNCDDASKLKNVKGRFIIKDDELQEFQSFYYVDDIDFSPKTEPEQTTEESENTVEEIVTEVEIERENGDNKSIQQAKKSELFNNLDFDFHD